MSRKNPEDLAPDLHIPRVVTWPRTRATSFIMTTDVQQIGPTELQQVVAVVGPGDELQPSTESNVATLGIAVKHRTFGRVITTAGHALMGAAAGTRDFDPGAPPLSIANVGSGIAPGAFTAIPIKAARIPEADYALLRPEAEPRNLYQDDKSLSGLHFAIPSDVGTPLFAMTRRGLMPTVLRGVAGTFTMGGVPMRGLLLVDAVTIAGDSGCCLIDASFRVWGLLVGLLIVDGVPRSIFAAADWVLALETAELG